MSASLTDKVDDVLAVAEVNVQKSSVWQRILRDKLLVFIFQSLPHVCQFLLRECPVLPLGGVPIVGSHRQFGSTRVEYMECMSSRIKSSAREHWHGDGPRA